MYAYYGLLAALAFGSTLALRDGLRLMRHLQLADRLIQLGLRADDAYRLAGCHFWDQPWYRRLRGRYPPTQLPDDLQRLCRT